MDVIVAADKETNREQIQGRMRGSDTNCSMTYSPVCFKNFWQKRSFRIQAKRMLLV